MPYLFSFYLQAKFLILQNKIFFYTLSEPVSTLFVLIFIILVGPRVKIDLLLSTCVPSRKKACKRLCVCCDIHDVD